MRRVNIFSPSLELTSEREGYAWRAMRFGTSIGAEQIGGTLYELGEGQRTYPHHFHHATEEWAIVVSGTPTLRDAGGERTLRQGDVVCFPTGPEGEHQLLGPGTLLILSANRSTDVTEYPDSGKAGVRPPGKIFRLADATDYWEGE